MVLPYIKTIRKSTVGGILMGIGCFLGRGMDSLELVLTATAGHLSKGWIALPLTDLGVWTAS